jgi:hypothetical protein
MPVNQNLQNIFVTDLARTLRAAFSEFAHHASTIEVYKGTPQYTETFNKEFKSFLLKELVSLYYKYTQGRYQYLNKIPGEQFSEIVLDNLKGVTADNFFDLLKDKVLSISNVIKDKVDPIKESKVNRLIKSLLKESTENSEEEDEQAAEAEASKENKAMHNIRVHNTPEDKLDEDLGLYPEGEGDDITLTPIDGEDNSKEGKVGDVVTMDIPLLIRVMEYAKEDAQSDLDLHKATEQMIGLAEEGRTLTMDDYESIFGPEKKEDNTVGQTNDTVNEDNDAFRKADEKFHPVTEEWSYPIMTKYGFKPTSKGETGFVRKYSFVNDKGYKIITNTGVNASYWSDPITNAGGYWGSLEPYVSKLTNGEEQTITEDNSEPRPARMARPSIEGMTKSATAYWSHLYIQDEAQDILKDKYGDERGEKYFEGLLNAPRFGGFYQAVTQIVMEKAKMYQELEERKPDDYFSESYYDVWKRWMASKGKTIKTSVEPKKVPAAVLKSISADINGPTTTSVKTKPAVNTVKTAPITTRSSSYEPKDEQRILDIVKKSRNEGDMRHWAQLMANKITDVTKASRRANAAEDLNYHDLALIFYKRYVQLGGK